jgi:hypothetical protein
MFNITKGKMEEEVLKAVTAVVGKRIILLLSEKNYQDTSPDIYKFQSLK